jgi:hypothetical protein
MFMEQHKIINMKRKNIDTGDVVGSIDYYVLKSGVY